MRCSSDGSRNVPLVGRQTIRLRVRVAFPLPPPPQGAFAYTVEWAASAVAPDGGAIAYSARTPGGGVKLWLRRIDSPDARPLDGTDGATSVFWSPDGRSLAFFAAGKLKRLEAAAGGAPVTICEVREGMGQMRRTDRFILTADGREQSINRQTGW